MDIEFDNTYAALPERFYSRVEPQPVSEPETIVVNEPLARQLGFDPELLNSGEGAELIVGNRLLEGSEPIAMAYAGHQFGNWVPQLGDGRALLLGEVVDKEGQRRDIQLKGSGRTPYSRRGDGRAPLGPVLREYLIAESMAALGIATTRALAAASTGDFVLRQQRLPGAVLVRVAKSHLRIGTFEYFASRGDTEAVEILVDYTIERHYPELAGGSALDLLDAVAEKQAQLVAQWQLVGFIHGVMNTDNMLLSGETIDYGPCAFMNDYNPDTVYSSIDRFGRYAYGNQPAIAQWNLSRLAQALVVSSDDEDEQQQFLSQAQKIIDAFPQRFRDAYGRGMAKKLGLTEFNDDDWPLIEDLLEVMAETNADYTLTFRGLSEVAAPTDDAPEFLDLPDAFKPWLKLWRARLADDPTGPEDRRAKMAAENPVFIPRNHLVEEALDDAVTDGDFTAFKELLEILEDPFTYRPEHQRVALAPTPDQCISATFCGT